MQGSKDVKGESVRLPMITTLAVRTLFKCPRNWTRGMRGKSSPTFYRHASAWMEMGLIERRKALYGSRKGYEYRRRVKSITFHEDYTMSFEIIHR